MKEISLIELCRIRQLILKNCCPEIKFGKRSVEAIDELEPDHREIVILRDIEGLSYDEIARILDLPEGTTKSRLHRAWMVVKEKLKKVLS